jgi:hypothetical protein
VWVCESVDVRRRGVGVSVLSGGCEVNDGSRDWGSMAMTTPMD